MVTNAPTDADRARMREELGFQRWEAIGHLLTDGDYLGFNQNDYRGAIAEYEKAWHLLSTPWQQETGGADILRGIAEFALHSNDAEMAYETLDRLLPKASQIESAELRETLDELAQLAGLRSGPSTG